MDDLEGVCPRCKGTGRDPEYPELPTGPRGSGQQIVYSGSATDCRTCDGRKTIPTEAGRALLSFLAKHQARR